MNTYLTYLLDLSGLGVWKRGREVGWRGERRKSSGSGREIEWIVYEHEGFILRDCLFLYGTRSKFWKFLWVVYFDTELHFGHELHLHNRIVFSLSFQCALFWRRGCGFMIRTKPLSLIVFQLVFYSGFKDLCYFCLKIERKGDGVVQIGLWVIFIMRCVYCLGRVVGILACGEIICKVGTYPLWVLLTYLPSSNAWQVGCDIFIYGWILPLPYLPYLTYTDEIRTVEYAVILGNFCRVCMYTSFLSCKSALLHSVVMRTFFTTFPLLCGVRAFFIVCEV